MSTGVDIACEERGREGSMYVEYSVDDVIGNADGGSLDNWE